ncbi:MAG TPA: hypothetical protein VGH38_22385 [Bryobacteraceae bacterium]|jgi:hypothetical protein
MKRLHETHGTEFELMRHFFARMLDGEWSSTPGQWQNVAVGAFALLLPASVLLTRAGSLNQGKYRLLSRLATPEPFRAAVLADELGLLTLLLAVTGLIALIQWQNLFPSRRDYLSLAGLPVRSSQIFLARFGTVLLFSTALVIAMNLFPSVVAPLEFGGRWQQNPSLPANIGAQAVSAGLGCVFVLFSMVALQGVLLNTLSGKWFTRVSTYVQGVLIGVLILTGLYSWQIRDWAPGAVRPILHASAWFPPVWFAGLHEQILGDPDPFFHRMAARALIAALAAFTLTVLAYLISYRRARKLLIEAPVHIEVPRKRQWSVLNLLSRDPQQQAILQFMAKTLARSRAHRVIWMAYAGAAIGIVLNSSLIDGAFFSKTNALTKAMKFMVLFWPLGTSFVLLSGLRHVLSIPSELPANWIFRLTESQGRKQWMSAMERFVLLYAIAPIYVLMFPMALSVLGWPLALRMTVQEVLVSLIIFDLLFNGWQQLPFTCSYAPGNRPLVMVVAGYFAILSMLMPLVTLIVRAGAEFNGLFLVYCPLFLAAWIWARRRRLEGWGESKLMYDDIPEGLPDLGIRDMTWKHIRHKEAH